MFIFSFDLTNSYTKFIPPPMADENENSCDKFENDSAKPDKMFTLKKWNAVAMWSWDVECDTCAICRVQVMGKC
jgi:RING-box protein 2